MKTKLATACFLVLVLLFCGSALAETKNDGKVHPGSALAIKGFYVGNFKSVRFTWRPMGALGVPAGNEVNADGVTSFLLGLENLSGKGQKIFHGMTILGESKEEWEKFSAGVTKEYDPWNAYELQEFRGPNDFIADTSQNYMFRVGKEMIIVRFSKIDVKSGKLCFEWIAADTDKTASQFVKKNYDESGPKINKVAEEKAVEDGDALVAKTEPDPASKKATVFKKPLMSDFYVGQFKLRWEVNGKPDEVLLVVSSKNASMKDLKVAVPPEKDIEDVKPAELSYKSLSSATDEFARIRMPFGRTLSFELGVKHMLIEATEINKDVVFSLGKYWSTAQTAQPTTAARPVKKTADAEPDKSAKAGKKTGDGQFVILAEEDFFAKAETFFDIGGIFTAWKADPANPSQILITTQYHSKKVVIDIKTCSTANRIEDIENPEEGYNYRYALEDVPSPMARMAATRAMATEGGIIQTGVAFNSTLMMNTGNIFIAFKPILIIKGQGGVLNFHAKVWQKNTSLARR